MQQVIKRRDETDFQDNDLRLQCFGPADKFYFSAMAASVGFAATGASLPTALSVGLAAGAGRLAKRIDNQGIAALAALGAGVAFYSPEQPSYVLGALIAAGAGALTAHKVPGFKNACWLLPSRLQEDGIPYQAFVNGDKVLSCAMLLCRVQQVSGPPLSVTKALLGVAVGTGTIGILMGAGIISGFVRMDPRLPNLNLCAR